MKNKKGFTLVELLAVIVVLGVIMTIATNLVINNINDSKKKAKFIAAKEITEIASVYMATEYHEDSCVEISELIENEYLENDVTNPKTGENGGDFNGQKICIQEDSSEQEGYDVTNNQYSFNGYVYYLQ